MSRIVVKSKGRTRVYWAPWPLVMTWALVTLPWRMLADAGRVLRWLLRPDPRMVTAGKAIGRAGRRAVNSRAASRPAGGRHAAPPDDLARHFPAAGR